MKASWLPGFLLWKLTLNATLPEAGNQYLLFWDRCRRETLMSGTKEPNQSTSPFITAASTWSLVAICGMQAVDGEAGVVPVVRVAALRRAAEKLSTSVKGPVPTGLSLVKATGSFTDFHWCSGTMGTSTRSFTTLVLTSARSNLTLWSPSFRHP